jgi:hypothetical protein
MREHIELRVYRSILSATGLDHLQVNDRLPDQFGQIEKAVWASPNYDDFASRYLLLNFLKKWKGWESYKGQEEAAYEAWDAAEKQCFRTNWRLKTLQNPITDSPMDKFIRQVRKHIIDMIGAAPRENWRGKCDWATGATATNRRDTLVHERVHEKATAGANAAKHMYGLYELGYTILKWNRLEFVPKTFKVHRPIACEPTINAFLQKGIGREIRSLLKKRSGVDLDTQASVNRDLCFLARSCNLSTIDLESASDTLSSSLVKLFLPESWFNLLIELRSDFTRRKTPSGTTHRYLEKFSSMGNGFTFELETLIFRAICLAAYTFTPGTDVSTLAVFGDDIVCDRRCFDLIVMALTFFGFIVNSDKTFKEGDFFESCGRHYYQERECTPAYCKEIAKTIPQLVILHNKLFRWAQRTGLNHIVRDALRLIVAELRAKVKGPLPYQPSFLDGDAGLCSTKPEGWRLDKHGDVLLSRAIVVTTSDWYVLHQAFYYQNALRCGNSIYTNDSGYLCKGVNERWRIRNNVKRWRSFNCK